MKIIEALLPIVAIPLFVGCASASPENQADPEAVGETSQALDTNACATGSAANDLLQILHPGDDQYYERISYFPNSYCKSSRATTIVDFEVAGSGTQEDSHYLFWASDPTPPGDLATCFNETINSSLWRLDGATNTWILVQNPKAQRGVWTPNPRNPLQGTCSVSQGYAIQNSFETSTFRVRALVTGADGKTTESVVIEGRDEGVPTENL